MPFFVDFFQGPGIESDLGIQGVFQEIFNILRLLSCKTGREVYEKRSGHELPSCAKRVEGRKTRNDRNWTWLSIMVLDFSGVNAIIGPGRRKAGGGAKTLLPPLFG
jgi:hypothetical protein